jgi:hypothetical protein
MIKPKSDNRTVGETPTRSGIKAAMAAKQAGDRAFERARAEAMRLPSGPRFVASTAPVEPHRKPVIGRR